MNAIEVSEVSKTFRVPKLRGAGLRNMAADFFRPRTEPVSALNNISFAVQEGQCVGYLGPNGAGKSSTIKCLTGILRPDHGHIKVLGRVPWQQRQHFTRNIGVVFGQKPLLLWDLPVIDTMRFYQRVYEVDDATYRNSFNEFEEVLGIEKLLNRPARKLSLGERMRCEIAVALLHRPRVLFLDEPTIGVDVVAKENLRQFLRYLIDTHRITVMLTTHQMDDVEALCNRILIINRGELLYDGDLASFRNNQSSSRRVHVRHGAITHPEALEACLNGTDHHEWADGWLTVDVNPADLAGVLARISAALEPKDIRIEEPRLETLISKWYTT